MNRPIRPLLVFRIGLQLKECLNRAIGKLEYAPEVLCLRRKPELVVIPRHEQLGITLGLHKLHFIADDRVKHEALLRRLDAAGHALDQLELQATLEVLDVHCKFFELKADIKPG